MNKMKLLVLDDYEGELASAGDGTVKTPDSAGVGVLFIADEAVTTGVGESSFIRAIVANY